ncbi:apoptosis regulator BAX-like [Rhopilema esculentum]|uniref:apoptosis regulator BAX-like n=1 Tax=Rhopilema esculentum TaxID=499914 RepID=UPI0031E13967|eukprot:gene11594-21832_t
MGPPVNRGPDRDEAQSRDVDEENEDGNDETDSPVRPRSVRQRTYRERVFHRDVSTVDEVMQEATGYVSSFIADRLDEDGFQVPDYLRDSSQNVKRATAQALRQIGDDMVNNQELNLLMDRLTVTMDNVYETFASIASEIFRDGVINWGRIVTLLYLGYKLGLKLLFEGGLLKTIIKWILRFISEKLVTWIAQFGGWDTCISYFGSTSAQMIGVFLAGCAVTALVFWMRQK